MKWRQIPHRKVYIVNVIKALNSPVNAKSPAKSKKVEKVTNPFAKTKQKKKEPSSNGKSLLSAIAKSAKVEEGTL
jgi:hypothetical protein